MTKYSNPDFVDTTESFSPGFFMGSNNIIIPYINVNLMPGNPVTNHLSFVDYSYYVFLDFELFEFASKSQKFILEFQRQKKSNNVYSEYIMVGNYKKTGGEARIKCESHHYYICNNSKYSEQNNSFIPQNTPNFEQTIREEDADTFFTYSGLPEELKLILGSDVGNFLWK